MNAREAALEVIRDSGMGPRELYRQTGNLSGFLYHGSTPRSDVLARIADACGYDLILRRRDDDYEIVIDSVDD